MALRLRVRVELGNLGLECPRVGELVQNEGDGGGIVSRGDHVVRELPQLDEPVIDRCDRSRTIDHQDAVAGCVERRVEQRERREQLSLDPLALPEVMARHDQPPDGRVIEEVHERQLERNRRAVRLVAKADLHRGGLPDALRR